MFGKRMIRFITVLAVVGLMASLFATSAGAQNPAVTKSPVVTFQEFDENGQVVFDTTPEQIPGAWSMVIRRGYGGLGWVFHTSQLEPGHVITVWALVFNNTDACTGGMCGGDDFLAAPGPIAEDLRVTDLNEAQIEATGASMIYTGGGIVGANGMITFSGVIVEGTPPGEVLFGEALTNAEGAEIHFALEDHGPASSDPAALEEQLTTYQGGCDTPCADPQGSVHLPPD